LTINRYPPSRRRQQVVLVVSLLLLVACDYQTPDRPREGAPPLGASTPARPVSLVPPTLAPASNLALTPTELPFAAVASPLPSPLIPLSPIASPGLYPIISSFLPAPGATLPPGDVVIGARITGSSDLVDVVAYIDGEAVPVDMGGQAVRIKVVNLVRSLDAGSHEIRMQARDNRGQVGGYRWQFMVSAGRAVPRATVEPLPPLPTLTPLPIPTRRPLSSPVPVESPRAIPR
jgi:hypothetical protein